MLCLSRKPGEQILIGDDITITVVRISLNQVRLAIDAPRSLHIVRAELDIDLGQTGEHIGEVP